MIGQKTFMTAATVGTLFVFGSGLYLFMNFGSIAKTISERVATNALGVQVSIARIDASLPEKKVNVHGIRIANPPGYKDAEAVSVRLARIELGSLGQDLIIFEDIQVSGTTINLEVNKGGTNLDDIRDYAVKKKVEKAQTTDRKPPKVIIRNILIDDSKLNPRTLLVGNFVGPVTIPDVLLQGIGEKSNGVLAREAVTQVFAELSRVATRAAAKEGFLGGLPVDVLETIGVGTVKTLKDSVKSIGGGVVREIFGD